MKRKSSKLCVIPLLLTRKIIKYKSMFNYFANPARFNRFTDRISPFLWVFMLIFISIGLILAIFQSPEDYQQGDSARIMYIHIPSAWMAMSTYFLIALCGIFTLIWKHPLASLAGKAAAPLGALFTILTLITGMLWGKPMWGTYWVWDARLTSVLILLFLYLGYIALWQALNHDERAEKITALLAIIGIINLPIIKFSVDWWQTLHQPASILRAGGPSISPEMAWPLFLMAIAFQLYFILIWFVRIKNELILKKIHHIQHLHSDETENIKQKVNLDV